MELNQLSPKVTGTATEIHGHLGLELLELEYQTALMHQLPLRKIPCRPEASLRLTPRRARHSQHFIQSTFLADETIFTQDPYKSSPRLQIPAPIHSSISQ